MYIHIVGKGIYEMDRVNIVTDSVKGTCSLKLRCRNVPVKLVDRDMSEDIANEILDDIAQAIKEFQSDGIFIFDEGLWFANKAKGELL